MRGGDDAAPTRYHVVRVYCHHWYLILRGDLAELSNAVVAHFEALLVGLALRLALIKGDHVCGIGKAGCSGGKSCAIAQLRIQRCLRFRSPITIRIHSEDSLGFFQRGISFIRSLLDLAV